MKLDGGMVRLPHRLVVAVVDVGLGRRLVREAAVVAAVKRRDDLRRRNWRSRWLYPAAAGQNCGQRARRTDLKTTGHRGLCGLYFTVLGSERNIYFYRAAPESAQLLLWGKTRTLTLGR